MLENYYIHKVDFGCWLKAFEVPFGMAWSMTTFDETWFICQDDDLWVFRGLPPPPSLHFLSVDDLVVRQNYLVSARNNVFEIVSFYFVL
jgi:hypothetical protein